MIDLSSYLANLGSDLTVRSLDFLGRRAAEFVQGTPKYQALKQCYAAAQAALLPPADPLFAVYQPVLQEFLADRPVVAELSKLSRGSSPDLAELTSLFEELTRERDLPDFDIRLRLAAAMEAFLQMAEGEPALQPTIQTAHLRQQTSLLQTLPERLAAQLEPLLHSLRSGDVSALNNMNIYGDLNTGLQIKATAPGAVAIGQARNVIIHPPPPPDPTPANLRQSYLNYVYSRCLTLSLLGVDPKAASDENAARLNLGAVYTALLTLSPEDLAAFGRDPLRPERRQPALAQLNGHAHLVLLGDPGSGKSTFINFVALCLAGASLPNAPYTLDTLTAPLPKDDGSDADERQPWQHGPLLPLRVELRHFAARHLPPAGRPATAQHLWDFIEAELKAAALAEFAPLLKQILRDPRQGGLLLLDGLDEVPEAEQRRVQLCQVVTDFKQAFPHCRMLVTSRTYAYQRQDWRLPDFAEAVLAPFSRGQINRFVERWYAHVAALRRQEAIDAQGQAERLKQAIFKSERLQELAERPLLLTLMASLHAWRGGSLPEKRVELYQEAVNLLLDTWESHKLLRDERGQLIHREPSLTEWLQVDQDAVRRLLNRLAYEVHAAQPETVGTADIPQDSLINGLLSLSKNEWVTSARLIEYLSQRAGLLVPHGVGVYTFPHRTFQEYLAASHLSADNETFPEPLDRLARTDPDRWREVALLAAARAGRQAIWSFVECLLAEHNPPPAAAADLWGARLAGQALLEVADVQQVHRAHRDKLRRLIAWLVYILDNAALPASERATVGQILAQLPTLTDAPHAGGDPRPGVGLHPDGRPDLAWCDVPAGPFLMGSDADQDPQAYPDEQPQHSVDLPGFKISRYPITIAQFAAFIAGGGYQIASYWPEARQHKLWQPGQVQDVYYYRDDQGEIKTKFGGWREQPYNFGLPFRLPNHPVVGINWYEALAFGRWLEEQLTLSGQLETLAKQVAQLNPALNPEQLKVRVILPSEAHWEKAARGSQGQIYPWGAQADKELANYADTGLGATSAVGCFPGGESAYGVAEMSGNVWEWTRSLWGSKSNETDFRYPYDAGDGREDILAPPQVHRVVRGGAFDANDRLVRCAIRYRLHPYLRYRYIGFRLVVAPLSNSGL